MLLHTRATVRGSPGSSCPGPLRHGAVPCWSRRPGLPPATDRRDLLAPRERSPTRPPPVPRPRPSEPLPDPVKSARPNPVHVTIDPASDADRPANLDRTRRSRDGVRPEVHRRAHPTSPAFVRQVVFPVRRRLPVGATGTAPARRKPRRDVQNLMRNQPRGVHPAADGDELGG